VIFSSRRNGRGEPDYATAADRMFELVQQQPGFLGAESTRDAEGFGITVAYFDSEENIKRWRNHAEHAAVRERGKREWYEHFELRVAKVERAYNGP
jgi:heme-degrading monooxygenase HmoA